MLKPGGVEARFYPTTTHELHTTYNRIAIAMSMYQMGFLLDVPMYCQERFAYRTS
jgi:hypothetical protein